ncbi:MAG: DivIVA domain-containing protein [Ilumatobacteraceae bacterium]|nr:DivIVA domain-containing protein [Ilumatobacteraceae bacterium]
MAISFSRPDPSSPTAVGSAAFPTGRRGFDQAEVRDFLKMVAAEMARLQERERFLESEMRAMQTRGLSAPGQLDEETVTTLLGEEAARVLTAARDASTQIRDRAEESATRLVKDAAEDAVRIRESAVLEAARIREDSGSDAESEIEMAKQQGRDMVNEAREYREKVLSELSRRRDAARSQIEQLLHGRDRLMNAFERARIASEDVIGGLTDAHDEPEFIVDLSPTTGPVPIINSEHPSVKMFDREEVIVAEEPAEVITNVVIFDHESEVEVEDITEEASVQVIYETQIVDVLHPVHTPADIAPSVDDDVSVELTETSHTNVVSLFGRGRRSVDMPELEMLAEEAVVAPVAKKGVVAVDDIFAKLRAGSTADVAAKATTVSDIVKDAEPSVKASAPKAIKKVAAKPTVPVVDPARFEARDEELSPVVVTMARKLKRVLADEQNTVLGHVRAKRTSLDIDAVLGTEAEHSARYATAVAEDTMAAASAGAKSVKAAGGSSRRVTQKAIAAHALSAITAGLIAGFREDARIAIGEAEGDRDVLLGLIRDLYRIWKTERINSHVDDIACSSYSHGAYLALEPGSRITWMAEPDANCCSECEDNSLGGPIVRGDDFPTGHSHPPAHAGCRCLVCPVQD